MAGWQKISEGAGERTDRMKVEGGYLYRCTAISTTGNSVALAYVPDTPQSISMVPPDEADVGAPVRYS